MDPAGLDVWRQFPTATISDCLGRGQAMDAGIRRLSSGSLVGPAFTVQTAAGDSSTIHRALASAPSGSVLVVDAAGHTARAVWGFVLTVAAQQRGIEGLVLDGVVRDMAALHSVDFPVFARGTCPAGPHKGFAGRWGQRIACGGVVVSPGDLVVGDDDGVVIVPGDEVEALPVAIRRRQREEERWRAQIRAGQSSAELLGLPDLRPPEQD